MPRTIESWQFEIKDQTNKTFNSKDELTLSFCHWAFKKPRENKPCTNSTSKNHLFTFLKWLTCCWWTWISLSFDFLDLGPPSEAFFFRLTEMLPEIFDKMLYEPTICQSANASQNKSLSKSNGPKIKWASYLSFSGRDKYHAWPFQKIIWVEQELIWCRHRFPSPKVKVRTDPWNA